MSMLMAIEATKKYMLRQREQERTTLRDIAQVVSIDYAEKAANILDHKKHNYSFEGYLGLLSELQRLIVAGLEPELALDAVQTGWTAESILNLWRYQNE